MDKLHGLIPWLHTRGSGDWIYPEDFGIIALAITAPSIAGFSWTIRKASQVEQAAMIERAIREAEEGKDAN